MSDKKRTVLSVFMMIAVLCLSGCSSLQGNKMEELQIRKLTSHLAVWQEELPKDKEYKNFDAAAVRGLVIRKDGKTVFAVSYEPRKEKETYDYWDISVPYQSFVSVNTEALYDLFGIVLQLPWDKKVKISLTEAGIADSKTSVFVAYNGEQNPDGKGEAEPTNGRTVLIGNENGQGDYYAALEGSNEVVIINGAFVDAIQNVDAYQYILKLPVLVNIDTVRKIQIISDGETHIAELEDDVWALDGRQIGQEEFQGFYTKLLGVMLSDKIENGKSGKTKEPVLTIQFLRNVGSASDVEVQYYEYNTRSMSVSVNGQECFLVEKKSIDDLQQIIVDSF